MFQCKGPLSETTAPLLRGFNNSEMKWLISPDRHFFSRIANLCHNKSESAPVLNLLYEAGRAPQP